MTDNQADYEFAGMYQEFTQNFQNPHAKNLAELIEFNKEHADLELPEGKLLSVKP